MRKTAIQVSLVVLAALTILALSANAQADFSNVQIKTNKISNNFYTLDGQGGTIGVLADHQRPDQIHGQYARAWRPHGRE
jgi:preprotein translocase subunit SecD